MYRRKKYALLLHSVFSIKIFCFLIAHAIVKKHTVYSPDVLNVILNRLFHSWLLTDSHFMDSKYGKYWIWVFCLLFLYYTFVCLLISLSFWLLRKFQIPLSTKVVVMLTEWHCLLIEIYTGPSCCGPVGWSIVP